VAFRRGSWHATGQTVERWTRKKPNGTRAPSLAKVPRMQNVTLQINLAPGDYYHAVHTLDHQIEVFESQTDEILLTFDFNLARLRGAQKAEREAASLYGLIASLQKQHPSVVLRDVDYNMPVVSAVLGHFFANRAQLYDFRGAPIYACLFGLYSAKNDLVFHIDSDMLFGGFSATWIREAIDLLQADSEIMTVSPLPGPPHPDRILLGQEEYSAYSDMAYAFKFSSMSYRVFFIDRRLLAHKLRSSKPPLKGRFFALHEGFPQSDSLERIISASMRSARKYRVDFLGSGRGLYSLHPLYRSEAFYHSIPDALRRLKDGDIPDDQLGHFNISDSFLDWGDAKALCNQGRLRNKVVRRLLGK
jgi:hypothetical protein